MRFRTPLAIIGALAVTGLTAASPALADGGKDTLQAHTYTCDFAVSGDCAKPTDGAYGKWVQFKKNGDDSPLDSNAKALVVHTPGNDLSAYDYTEVYSKHSLDLNVAASAIQNLSFDAYKPALQGGSPRIDVYLANPASDGSTYVAIDAGNCQQSLSSTWVRADATGRKAAGCTIYTSNGHPYSSDGTNTAWQNFLVDNPDAVVAYTFMVFDESTRQHRHRLPGGPDRPGHRKGLHQRG